MMTGYISLDMKFIRKGENDTADKNNAETS